MFHFDRGLKLTKADLAIDFRRRQPRAFISHAHADHMARHEYALCTPATAALYQLRFGPRPTRRPALSRAARVGRAAADHLSGRPLPGLGHAVGRRRRSVAALHRRLQAGRIGHGRAGRAAAGRHAGHRKHLRQPVLPPSAARRSARPAVHAGARRRSTAAPRRSSRPTCWARARKSRRLLTRRRLSGAAASEDSTPSARSIARAASTWAIATSTPAMPLPGHVVVVPPRMHRAGRLPGLKQTVTFAVTGWATHERTRGRLGVDHAMPLSDHADYDELFEAVERVAPSVSIARTARRASSIACGGRLQRPSARGRPARRAGRRGSAEAAVLTPAIGAIPMQSKAKSVGEYLAALPADRRAAISAGAQGDSATSRQGLRRGHAMRHDWLLRAAPALSGRLPLRS